MNELKRPYIAPSVLSADFGNLERDIRMLNESEADWIHIDVMDGRFVPNISFGFPIIQAIKKVANKPLDVHLMIVEPDKYLEEFAHSGADILTIHFEACLHLNRTLSRIKELGMKAGVTLNPHTPVSLLEETLPYCDMVLIMSVNPGYGGQKFIPESIQKVKKLKTMILERNPDCLIEIDGGVDLQNHKEIVKAGVDILVAGSTVFKSADPKSTILQLKQL